MEVQAIRIRLTDADLPRLLALLDEEDLPAKELRAQLTGDGIVVEGKYPTVLLTVPFRMCWKVSVVEGLLQARLVNLDFHGMPAGPLRGLILSFVRDELSDLPGVSVHGETVLVNLEKLLAHWDVAVQLTPREVRHEPGALVFIGGEA